VWKTDDFKPRSSFGKAVMGLSEAQAFFNERQAETVTEISEVCCNEREGVCFFTNDYLIGYKVLPKNFVPSSTVIPHRVKPRAGLEDGWVKNLNEYDFVYRRGGQRRFIQRRLNTLEELVAYLNTHYPKED
jgi:hypothetical protein